jgi:anti-sigma factor RsiW
MSADHPIQEEDLHAYVDDALTLARRAEVDDYLSRHPDVVQRVRHYARQRAEMRSLLAPIAEEPVPPQLNLARMLEAHRTPRAASWRLAAAVLLAFGLGGTGGWAMRGAPDANASGIGALAREAAMSYQIFASDTARPVELDGARSAELVNWVSKRLQRPIALPDMTQAGYRLMGGRLVATEHGPAAMFMYDDKNGTRVAMLVRPMEADRDMPMTAHTQGGVAGYAWADKGLGYSLVADAALPGLHPLADAMRRQIGEAGKAG